MRMATMFSVFAATVLVGVAFLGLVQNEKGEEACGIAESQSESPVVDFRERIPEAWRVMLNNPNARGWKQTGVIPCGFDMAVEQMRTFMRDCGYAEKFEPVKGGGQFLSEFTGHDGSRVMWLLSPRDDGDTNYSWGIVK